MFNYKSRELKSINDSIIFAFDTTSNPNAQMAFGISQTKDSNIIERNIYVLKDTILQENQFSNDICTYNNKNGDTILTNYGDFICGKEYLILSPTLQSLQLEDGNVELSNNSFTCSFYIQNNNASPEVSKIYKDNKTYQRIPTSECELSPILIEDICFNESGALFSAEPHPLLAECENDEEFVLCADYEITIKNKNDNNNGLGFSTVILMENDKVIGTNYTNLITDDRTRFIISNKGRNFSIASKVNDNFSSAVTYLFDDEFIPDSNGEVSIRFSINSQNIENLTANF